MTLFVYFLLTFMLTWAIWASLAALPPSLRTGFLGDPPEREGEGLA